jgi:hypothetical protein
VELNAFRTELSEYLDEGTIARLWSEGEALSLKEALTFART